MELFNMVECSDYFANPDNWKLKSELELTENENIDLRPKIEYLILSMVLDSRVNYD